MHYDHERTLPPQRISRALALSVGLIARHDLKNEAVQERSSFAIVPDCVSKLSSFPRVSFAVAMGDVMYVSENSGVPVNKSQTEALTVHPNIHISDLVSIRPFPLSRTSGAAKFFEVIQKLQDRLPDVLE